MTRNEHKQTFILSIQSSIDALDLAGLSKERFERALRFFQDERTNNLTDDEYYKKVDLILYDLNQFYA